MVLICFHDVILDLTTNVATHKEFKTSHEIVKQHTGFFTCNVLFCFLYLSWCIPMGSSQHNLRRHLTSIGTEAHNCPRSGWKYQCLFYDTLLVCVFLKVVIFLLKVTVWSFNFSQDCIRNTRVLEIIGVDGLFTNFTGSLHNYQEWTPPLPESLVTGLPVRFHSTPVHSQ